MATDDDGSILRRKMGLVFPRVSLFSGHISQLLVNCHLLCAFLNIINTVTDCALLFIDFHCSESLLSA